MKDGYQKLCSATLSPGQTDSQVDANRRKLNLRRDLRWVAKGTRKFPRKYTLAAKRKKKEKKKTFQGYGLSTALQYPVFHWLKGCYSNEWTTLNLH